MSRPSSKSLSETFRESIRDSGLSLTRIATDTGIVKSSLIRFLRAETSLRLDKADVLAEYLGLKLVRKRKV